MNAKTSPHQDASNIRLHHAHTVARLVRPLALAVALIGTTQVVAHADSGPAKDCVIQNNNPNASFGSRLIDAYKADLAATNEPEPGTPPATVDGVPVPESNPPYPYSTWPTGGSETIGQENMTYGPLMDAIYCGPDGQAIKDSRIVVYGWLNPGGNLSTSKSKFNFATGSGGNAPAAYSYQPNTVQLDQLALYIERTPDEVQKDHYDWGFRISGLYGADYKYTFANGINPAFKQYTQYGQKYGFDPVMEYFDFYSPFVADGMNIRVGRYISIPDIEAQLAPNNLTYSHSMLYAVDPYTQTGIVDTIKLNKNWMLQTELSAGNDVAIWDKNGHTKQLTPAVCVQWTSDDGKDSLYPCLNTINGAKFAWNNIQHPVVTWYHKFNDKWHMDTEFYYMFEKDVPNVDNSAGQALLASDFPNVKYGAPSGAQCANPNALTCTARMPALVNYIEYSISGRDYISYRNDWLKDEQGQRTGFKTLYYETALSWTHWIGNAITIRPEIRFEHSFDTDAYDNPSATAGMGKKSQTMLAADAIFHF